MEVNICQPRQVLLQSLAEPAQVNADVVEHKRQIVLQLLVPRRNQLEPAQKLLVRVLRQRVPRQQRVILNNQGVQNAVNAAKFLKNHEKVAWVNCPSLEGDKYYDLARKYMPNGTCGVITFGVKGGRDACVKMMDALKMIAIVTHVADSRSCVLHPASHTHRQMNEQELLEAGVQPDLIRFSVGTENIEDIIDDLKQALESI